MVSVCGRCLYDEWYVEGVCMVSVCGMCLYIIIINYYYYYYYYYCTVIRELPKEHFFIAARWTFSNLYTQQPPYFSCIQHGTSYIRHI